MRWLSGVLMVVALASGGCEGREPEPALDAGLEDAAPPLDGELPERTTWHTLSPRRAGEFVHLSEDGHFFERIAIGPESAGSEHGVKAHDGIFYFEMESLVASPDQRFGVGPADMELTGYVGDHPASLGASGRGEVRAEGEGIVATFDRGAAVLGFVVDRRGAYPLVHVVAEIPGQPSGAVVATRSLDALEGPVHAYVSGPRLALGYQARFNAGYDTTNDPFVYDPRAALGAIDPEAAKQLVLGWGASESSPWNEPPVVSIAGASSAAPGAPVLLRVGAHDPEDGDLSAKVVLEDDALPHAAREVTLEGGGIFRTSVVGRHRLRASAVDSGGKRAEAVHVLDVQGSPPLHASVRLFTTSGDGAILSDDARGVRFTAVEKNGVRANQGLLDGFWYFEASRLGPPGNFGAGLVVQEGSIVPYGLRVVAASMSMNFLSGIWHDIIWFAPQPEGGPHLTVGFAVDYRRALPEGRDYPTVHVIVAGVLAASVPIYDATTPVHPMLYGTVGPETGPQLGANFGQSPFVYDARAILAAAGHGDADQLQLGWGVHSR
jgi:hypothetical protein